MENQITIAVKQPAEPQKQCKFLRTLIKNTPQVKNHSDLQEKIFSNVDNIKDGRLITIRLKPEQVQEAYHLLEVFNNPQFATGQEINIMFANLLAHGVAFKNQTENAQKTILENMADFLSNHIFKVFLNTIEREVIINDIFFPTISDFIRVHKNISQKYAWTLSKAVKIIEQSIEYYNSQLKTKG